jgi:hypothetical protein
VSNGRARWWPARPEPAATWPTWLALLIAAALLTGTGTPPVTVVACLMVVTATLLVSLRWQIPHLALLVLLACGLALRAAAVGGGWSDVLIVTQAAIRTMLDGSNPYGIGYPQSVPPGAPFAYGPLALLWYLPSLADPGRLELLLTMGLLGVFAIRGRPLGLALFATLPALLVTATDGSNDTSAGVLLLVALLAAQRVPVLGGALLALAVSFKPYALAWLLPLLAYGGVPLPLLAFVVTSLICWGWAVVAWGAGPILDSLRRADGLHPQAYYSLAWVVADLHLLPESGWAVVRYVAGVLTAIVGWAWVRTARSFVVVGIAIFLVTLFTGWWSTFAYLAAIAPVVCWHLDDWLGLDQLRIRWPGDPVGACTRWVDRRWPIKRPWWGPDADTA